MFTHGANIPYNKRKKKEIVKMKKLTFKILAISALLASALFITGCSKKAKLTPVEIEAVKFQHENITVTVDPKSEIILAALRLTEKEPFNQNYYGQEYGQYIDGLDKLLAKQKDHPFVKTLKANYDPQKTYVTEFLKITRYISDDLTSISITKKELPEEMKPFWKKMDLNQFLADMNDFAVQSNFARIWVLYNPHLKRQAINVMDYYKSLPQITNWISDFYFAENNKPDFELFATTATAGYFYTPTMIKKENKTIVQNYVPAYIYDKDYPEYSINPTLILSRSIIDSCVFENWNLISEPYNKILDKILEDNQITVKYTEENKKELLSKLFAIACIFNYEYVQNDEEISTQLENMISQSFLIKEPEKILSMADYYIDNRETYPDFGIFFKDYITAAIKDLQ